MKKGLLIALAALILILPVSGIHAAMIELVDLPDSTQPGVGGSIDFGVYLVDIVSLPNIDSFNVGLQISGATGLEMDADSLEGPDELDYIFAGNSFAFSSGNRGGDMSQVVFGDVTDNGIGVELGGDPLLLGRISLVYPAIASGEVLTFSLIPGENFVISDGNTESQMEDLVMTGRTTINAVPIPAAIWMMGGGLLALFRIRRFKDR